MRPILFTVAGFPIRAYGFFIAVGVLAGIWLAVAVARKRRKPYAEALWDLAAPTILAGVIGARIWEVVFTWGYYGTHLAEIPQIWHGGLSIQGAILGGGLTAVWFARKHNIGIWGLLDALTPGALLGQAIGRLGACLLNGDAYGKPTGSSWFGVIYQPGTAAYQVFGAQRLWPAEVFEGLWDMVVLAIVLRMMLRGETNPGRATLWYLLLYSLGRFSLEFLRADSLGFFGTGLKAAQITSLLIAAVAAVLLLPRPAARMKSA